MPFFTKGQMIQTNKPFSRIMKITTKVLFYIDKIDNFDSVNFIFSLIFSQKWEIQWQKICLDIYGKLKSKVLNIIESLHVPDILEICYLYDLLWKYIKTYISIQASIFLFVSSVLKCSLCNKEREILLNDIHKNNQNLFNLSDKKKFIWILTNENISILHKVCNLFGYHIWNKVPKNCWKQKKYIIYQLKYFLFLYW
jgi:hypothetical protein